MQRQCAFSESVYGRQESRYEEKRVGFGDGRCLDASQEDFEILWSLDW